VDPQAKTLAFGLEPQDITIAVQNEAPWFAGRGVVQGENKKDEPRVAHARLSSIATLRVRFHFRIAFELLRFELLRFEPLRFEPLRFESLRFEPPRFRIASLRIALLASESLEPKIA
jgi:hypothetical protein